MESFADFRNLHAGCTIVVCGCGASLEELRSPGDFITIGVNDVGRLFQPTYLVVVNPRHQFRDGRFRHVEASQAQYIFTQLNLGLGRPGVIRFRLGQYGGTDFSDPSVLHYTQNSPYVALCLATYLGARRIGLIGVDFTEHHFFGATRRHPLASSLKRIDEEYRKLGAALAARGIEVVNLSNQSRLTAFPKEEIAAFRAALPAPRRPDAAVLAQIGRRVFFIHYRFLACGDIFRTGLMHAAAALKLNAAEAYWDDPALEEQVRQFNPELLFVVHGHRFSHRWAGLAKQYPSVVWLLDEPYEVDDTSKFSGSFRWVFVERIQYVAPPRECALSAGLL